MTDKAGPNKTAQSWRLWGLLAILGVLVAVALSWGVRFYFVSSAELAIRDRQLEQAHRNLNFAKWWGGDTALLRSRLARLEGDFRAASRFLDSARRDGGDSPALHVEQLMLYAQSGFLQPLVSELGWLVTDGNNDSAELFYALCRGQLLIGDLDQAKLTIDRWLAADIKDARAHFELGRFFEITNNFAEARSAYQRAVTEFPFWSDARLSLAEMTLAAGDAEVASNLFQQVLVSDSSNPRALLGCTAALIRAKRVDEAAKVYGDLVKLNQDSFSQKLVAAELEIAQENYAAALNSLASPLKRRPKALDVNRLRLIALEGKSQLEESEKCRETLAQAEAAIQKFDETKRTLIEEKSRLYARWFEAGNSVFAYDSGRAIYPYLVCLYLNSEELEPLQQLAECFELSGHDRMAKHYREGSTRLSQQIAQSLEKELEARKKPDTNDAKVTKPAPAAN